MQPSALAKRLVIPLFIIVIAFYFFDLGYLPLVGPDEPRYAQVAREMFLRNDFVTPTLGGHTWFEKPALLYWMMMLSYRLFGVTEFAARLGPAICGLLTIAAIFVLSRRVEQDHGEELAGFSFWTTAGLATSLGLIVFSRAASFDIVITMTITWALVFFFLHELATTGKNKRLLLAGLYVSIGLSLLAKGLVGIVVPVGVVGLHYILKRKPARHTLVSLFWGVPLSLLVALIWYGPVISQHGWIFIDEFFIQHHFARYVSNKYRHPQPVYFYLPVLLMITLPWTAFLIDALTYVKPRKEQQPHSMDHLRISAVCWLLFPVLFFSFSGSKLPAYILPSLPAAAILIGERLTRIANSELTRRWPVVATGLMLLFLGGTGLFYASRSGMQLFTAALILLPLFVASLVSIFFSRFRSTAMLIVAAAVLLTLSVIIPVSYNFAKSESVKDLLAIADARGLGRAPVYLRRQTDRTAEFYASGRVVYGQDGEPLELHELFQVIAEARRRGEPILVLVPTEYLEPYKQSREVEIIASNGNTALLTVK